MQITFEQIDQLEAERKRLGIPVHALCEQAKVHQSTYQRWRNREYLPLSSKLNSMYAALDHMKKKSATRKKVRA